MVIKKWKKFSSKSIGSAIKRHLLIFEMFNLIVVLLFFIVGYQVGQGNINLFSQTNSLNSSLPSNLNYSSVNQVYQTLKNNYDGKITQTQLLNGIKHGLAASLNDPYTVYFTANEAKQFNNQLNNTFSGIGAELGQTKTGQLEVIAPINNSPAAKAGLKSKDVITKINGKSTSGMSLDTAVNLIRGKSNTKVNLAILRNGTQLLDLSITRQNIVLPSVTSKIINGNIGYMQISTFANDTSVLANKAAQTFLKNHVKGIILDLRNDPGGLLSAAINVSSLWLPSNQLVLQEKRGNVVLNSYYSLGDDILHGIPTVVLINGGSASASEITTGALHDNKQAYVIGQKSFGKGVVQQLINFSDGSQLKVTIAKWYRPDGQNINHLGITPDQTINLTSQDVSNGNDVQLTAAEHYLAIH